MNVSLETVSFLINKGALYDIKKWNGPKRHFDILGAGLLVINRPFAT